MKWRLQGPATAVVLSLHVVACGSDPATRSAGSSAAAGARTVENPPLVAQRDLSEAFVITPSQETTWRTTLMGNAAPERPAIEVRNVTDVALGIEATIAGSDSDQFHFEQPFETQSLAPGEAATVNVSFVPTHPGKKDASVQFTAIDPEVALNRHVFAVALGAEARPFTYVGLRGVSDASAGSYLLAADPTNPSHLGRPGDRSVALAADGDVLYLAYKDGSRLYDPNDGESGRVTVAKYDQGAWSTLGTAGFSDGDAMWLSIAVHRAVPYVAFSERVGLTAPRETKITVMQFDGASWVAVGAKRFTPGNATFSSLYVGDNQGQPELYVSFCDGEPHLEVDGTDRRSAASVMRFAQTAWEFLGTPTFSFPEPAGSSTSIALSKGTPFVAYGSGLSRFDALTNTWNKVGTFSASSTAITASTTGETYVAIADLEHAGRTTVFNFLGDALLPLGEPGFSVGPSSFVSLGWRSENLLVAYADAAGSGFEAGAVAASFVGGGWSPLGAGVAAPGPVSHLSLAIARDRVYLAFKDEDWRAMPSIAGTGKASVIMSTPE